jgi:hypothetical protein
VAPGLKTLSQNPGGRAGVLPNAAWFLPEAKPLDCASLLCAFFECSICPLNSDQVKHKGGSKLPHSKARSARDRKTHCAGLGIPPVLGSRSAWS